MPTLTTRTALAHNFDLLISLPEGRTFLCCQFQTASGPSPIYSIALNPRSLDELNKLQTLLDSLAFTLQTPACAFSDAAGVAAGDRTGLRTLAVADTHLT